MTLTTRLLLFFLGTLAVVLIGFSVTVYLLASNYLYWRAEEQLESALNGVATFERIGPNNVELHFDGGTSAFGPDAGESKLHWAVVDGQGRRVDGSADRLVDPLLAQALPTGANEMQPLILADSNAASWLMMLRRLKSGSGPASSDTVEDVAANRPNQDLVLGAGLNLDEQYGLLHGLAGLLVLLSTVLWLAALVCGRRMCRRALAPVIAMARATDEISADELSRRLPAPATKDELGDLSRAFNELLDRLQESFERQQRFTSDASHQLRSPVTAILGQAELALRRERSVDEYQGVLSSVQRQAKHLQKMIEALLFLARADADAPPPELERIDLTLWAKEYVSETLASGRGQGLDLVIEDPTAIVVAHPLLLRELLDILVDNAIKYGAPDVAPLVRLRQDNDHVAISVEDHGQGISPQDLPHIFDPFYRSANFQLHKASGLGLGLSIARRLAVSFGATLDVESKVGQGAVFTIRFPHVASMKSDAESHGTASQMSAVEMQSTVPENTAKRVNS